MGSCIFARLSPRSRAFLVDLVETHGLSPGEERRGGGLDRMVVLPARPNPRELARLRDALKRRLGLPSDLLLRVTTESASTYQEMVAARFVRLARSAVTNTARQPCLH